MARSVSLPWLRPLLVVLLVVAVPLLIYVLFYVGHSVDSERRRAFNALAAISTQLDERLRALETAAGSVDKDNAPAFLKAFPNVTGVSKSGWGPAPARLALDNEGLLLNAPCAAGAADCCEPAAGAENGKKPASDVCSIAARMPLEALVPWAQVRSDFDGLLIFRAPAPDAKSGAKDFALVAQDRRLPAQPRGSVIYLQRGDTTVALDKWLTSGDSAATKSAMPFDFAREWLVEVGGTRYMPFIQQLSIPTDSIDSATTPQQVNLIVCALVDQERFRHEAIALEPATLVRLLAAVLLFALLIPFLKLRFIGSFERMRKADMWLLGGSILCITSLLMAVALHEFARYPLQTQFDNGMRALVGEVRAHSAQEADAARRQLTDTRVLQLLFDWVKPDGQSQAVTGSMLTSKELTAFDYPLFEAIFYASFANGGQQLSKMMARTVPTRMIKVGEMSQFRRAAALSEPLVSRPQPAQSVGQCGVPNKDFVFSPEVAPTTGLLIGTFALPASMPNFATNPQAPVEKYVGGGLPVALRTGVVTLAAPMASLQDAMVRAPYQFVVLENDAVFYQSAQGPFRGEKIFESIDDGTNLRRNAALCGKWLAIENHTYGGNKYRMLATRLDTFPYQTAPAEPLGLSLVAFYPQSAVTSLNAAAFGIACAFSVVVALTVLLSIVLARTIFGPDVIEWAWPTVSRNRWYAVGIPIVIALGLLLWFLHIWWLALIVPALAVFAAGATCHILVQRKRRVMVSSIESPSLMARRIHVPLFITFGFLTLLLLAGVPTAVAYDLGLGFVVERFESGAAAAQDAEWQRRDPLKGQFVATSEVLDRPRCSGRSSVGDVRCAVSDRIYATARNFDTLKTLEYELRHYTTCAKTSDRCDGSRVGFSGSRVITAEMRTWLYPLSASSGELGRLRQYWSRQTSAGEWRWRTVLVVFLTASLVAAALVFLVTSVARYVLGLKTHNAPLLSRVSRLRPRPQARWLILRPSDSELQSLGCMHGVQPLDLRDIALVPDQLSQRPPQVGGLLLVKNVELRLADKTWRKALLNLAGSNDNRTIALVSSIDPFHYLAQRVREQSMQYELEPAATRAALGTECEELRGELAQWSTVLDRFEKVRSDAADRLTVTGEVPCGAEEVAALTWAECRYDSHLLEIRAQLLRDPRVATYEWDDIVDMILDAAEPHYRTIWDLCSREEKLVLVQLAEEGLVNPKRTDVVRRMARRGLIRMEPRFCIVNESFAMFLRSVEPAAQVASWESEKQQTWKRIAMPLYVLAAVVVALLLYTEQSFFTSVIALASGAAGALGSLRSLYSQAKGISGGGGSQPA